MLAPGPGAGEDRPTPGPGPIVVRAYGGAARSFHTTRRPRRSRPALGQLETVNDRPTTRALGYRQRFAVALETSKTPGASTTEQALGGLPGLSGLTAAIGAGASVETCHQQTFQTVPTGDPLGGDLLGDRPPGGYVAARTRSESTSAGTTSSVVGNRLI